MSYNEPARVFLAVGWLTLLAAQAAGVTSPVFANDASASSEPVLTRAERIAFQERLERVEFRHTLGTTRSFEEQVPGAVIASKVDSFLRAATALRERYGVTITATQLHGELDRIARETRDPNRLKQIFGALNDDAWLVQECLIRPLLTDRTLRVLFDSDERIHGEARRSIEQLREAVIAGRTSDDAGQLQRTVLSWCDSCDSNEPATEIAISRDEALEWLGTETPAVGVPGPITERDGRYYFAVSLQVEASQGRLAVYQREKQPFESWWRGVADSFSPATDSVARRTEGIRLPPITDSSSTDVTPEWNNGALGQMPEARDYHTAVWSGSEVLIWGGATPAASFGDGFRYNPALDQLTRMSITNAPRARSLHAAVWTGSELIVWGGRGNIIGDNPVEGGRYNPATDTWAPMSVTNAPVGRESLTAVWSGTEMIVWGGYFSTGNTATDTGGRYNPTTDTWTATSTLNAPTARAWQGSVWSGDEMIIWGGQGNTAPVYRDSGARYNPSTNTWITISTTNAPSGRSKFASVWSGSQMVLWGGLSQTAAEQTGGRYDPASDSWSPITAVGAPSGRVHPTGVWTGNRFLVWGGGASSVYLNDGGAYDPALDAWSAITTVGAPLGRSLHTAVWTGSRMMVWGGEPFRTTGGLYDPVANTWTPTFTVNDPDTRDLPVSAWTGSQWLIFGGRRNGLPVNTGGRYVPAIDQWLPMSSLGGPTGRSTLYPGVWAGDRMIVFGGADLSQSTQGGYAYFPVSDSWTPISSIGAPSARRYGHTLVSTGPDVLLWGGADSGGCYAQGAKYQPATDAWSPIPTTGSPRARCDHLATWTGTRMLIWGGNNQRTGDIYDPTSGTWSYMSESGAPAALRGASAAWSGTEWTIWGGSTGPSVNSGAAYNPQTNAWRPLSNSNAPSPRFGHKAVWTGKEMVVWGSFVTSDRTGGRYDPATDSWTATPLLDAPLGRFDHVATWTGAQMLVWGGASTQNGGRLTLDAPVDSDGDGAADSADCAPNDPQVYPAAGQLCDGKNNDCNSPTWPIPPANEADQDADGFRICAGDCADNDASRKPGAIEVCNALDDDCDGSIDEDAAGVDSDGDGVKNVCDNCVTTANTNQVNADGDSRGNACDNCVLIPNNDQLDTDGDAVGNVCDNCTTVPNASQADLDADLVGDACDNCVDTKNQSQGDLDADTQGDECDLNDGVLFFRRIDKTRVRWQYDPLFSTYNLYRGSLAVLRSTGVYTQAPGSNPYAGRFCGLTVQFQDDTLTPSLADAYYWLVTGKGGGGESALGDGEGVTRGNSNPCP